MSVPLSRLRTAFLREGDRPGLRFVLEFDAPVPDLWRAITDPAEVDLWFPAHMSPAPKLGATLVFSFLRNDMAPPPGEVTAFDAPHRFAFTWGDDDLLFELVQSEAGCRLTFTHTFDPSGETAKIAAGWAVCFEALDALVEGEAPDVPRRRWDEHHRRFAAELASEGGWSY